MKFTHLVLLLLMFLVTLSYATEIGCGFDTLPKYGAPIGNPMYKEDDFYTYKLAFDRENELYMYKFKKDGSGMEVRHYARLQNNYEITHHTGFSTQVFYRFACPSAFPTLIYPLRKFDVNNDPKINTAKYIIDVYAVDTDFSVQHCKLGYDLANHKCADDCEHITDKELRFQCACAKHFEGAVYMGVFSDDPNTCKSENIKYTPKCCFGCKKKDGTTFNVVVDSANPYAEYGCFYDEIDHLHLENPKPKPDPDKPNPDKPDPDKPNPDKPDKPNPDKPDKPNPDKPNPGGGGGKPGGGGSKPDKPGDDDKGKDKNNTHPGGGGGGKPGDKDNDKSGTAPDISSDLEKGIKDSAKSFDSASSDYKSKIEGLVSDIKKAIGKIKDNGFIKLGKGREVSCPVTSKTIDFKYFQTSFTYDWCEFLSKFYYVFYFLTLCTCLFFGLKFILAHTFHIGGGSE